MKHVNRQQKRGAAAIRFCLYLAVLLVSVSHLTWAAAPTISQIADQKINQGTQTAAIPFTVGDAETQPETLTLTKASSNLDLVPNAAIVLEGSGADRTVIVHPIADQHGEAQITITVSDGTEQASSRFTVTVNAPPTMSDIPNQTINEDQSTGPIRFTIGDPDTPFTRLTLARNSSNTLLIPETNITFGGSGANRTVTVIPAENENGTATLTVTVKDDLEASTSRRFDVTVKPVNDPPHIRDTVVSPINDNESSALFRTLTIEDVDHGKPGDETLTVQVSLSDNGTAVGSFDGPPDPFAFNGTPTRVTEALQAQTFTPIANRLPVGQRETFRLTLTATDTSRASATLSEQASLVSIVSVNDPPTLNAVVHPETISDTKSVNPFTVTVSDPDLNDSFTLNIKAEAQGDPAAPIGDLVPATPSASLSASEVQFSGNASAVAAAAKAVTYRPAPNRVAGSRTVKFIFTVTDAGNLTATATGDMTLQETNDPPEIFGARRDIIRIFDNGQPFPFETVRIEDVDEGGDQQMTVTIAMDDPRKGTLTPTGPFTGTPADVSQHLQKLQFIPAPVADGQTEIVVFTITVRDSVGAERSNSETRVAVTGINGAPVLTGIPQSLPVQLSPSTPVRPFSGIQITDDDPEPTLTVVVSLDDSVKGQLIGSFTQTAPGVYEIAKQTLRDARDALTALEFRVNPSFPFAPDQPGYTTFTIQVSDAALNQTTAILSIILQDAARNHLVTRAVDDQEPGSLRHALSVAASNDVVTFALPQYPEQIRLDRKLGPLRLVRNVTLKGPGSDHLVISGDTDGDGQPDTQIFRVEAIVDMEGIAITKGAATSGPALTGGAIYVNPSGRLTLRYCAVTDSQAAQWGGAIDVNRGSLVMEHCLVRGNTVSKTLGLGGGAISLHTDQACAFVNTTFSANQQLSASGFGGGALYVENFTPKTRLAVDVIHSTFAENVDVADKGTAISANVFGTEVRVKNSIFADGAKRNLEVQGTARIISLGGNVSDDSTRVLLNQGGLPRSIILLHHPDDQTQVDPLIGSFKPTLGPTAVYPLQADSPAIGRAVASDQPTDQRGVIRDANPDSGAVEFGATARLVLNEIQTKGAPDDFLEFYVPRNAEAVDLSGYSLWVDGGKAPRHTFATPTVIQPGFGIILANSSIASTPGAPVVKTDSPLELTEHGRVELRNPGNKTVFSMSYVDVWVDPHDPATPFPFADNSLTLAPQFAGAAYLPHRIVEAPPRGGANLDNPNQLNQATSPGKDTANTPFGSPNAHPLALLDQVLVNEDERQDLSVTANDLDADGNDRAVIVNVSPNRGVGGDNATAVSQYGAVVRIAPASTPLRGATVHYDPTVAARLQALPEGAKQIDRFVYEIIDVGSAAILKYEGITGAAPVTVVSPGHRLATGDRIVISGADVLAYNGEHEITRIDVDTFSIPVAFAGNPTANGTWVATEPRASTKRSEAEVQVTVLGTNDPPTPVRDRATTDEETIIRLMGDPVLPAGARDTQFDTDDEFPMPPQMSLVSILSNDTDIDTDDHPPVLNAATSPPTLAEPAPTLRIVGIVNPDDDVPRLEAVSTHAATVKLGIRTDRIETNIVYNPRASSFLNGLALGESVTDTVIYAVADRHGAVRLGAISIEVAGVNDLPQPVADPDALTGLAPLRSAGETLADLLAQLQPHYSLPAASGRSNRADLTVQLGDDGQPLVIDNIFTTDEDNELMIRSIDVLANDTDPDRSDVPRLRILSVSPTSREGAAVRLSGDGQTITYDPRGKLDRLYREELLIDSFELTVTDGHGGEVESLVAVLVIGANDKPMTADDRATTLEDQVLLITPADVLANDWDDNVDLSVPENRQRLQWEPGALIPTQGETVTVSDGTLTYDPRPSAFLDGLAVGQTFSHTFSYTVVDGSLVFAQDDVFQVAADGAAYGLDVLANDRNLNDAGGNLQLLDEVGKPNRGGTATIEDIDGVGRRLVYTPEVNFVGDEVFIYKVSDKKVSDQEGNSDRGLITLQVIINRLNGNLSANDDHFSVAKGESPVLDVLANDDILPQSGGPLTITQILTKPAGGDEVRLAGNVLTYVQKSIQATPYTDTFTYEVSGGGSARATAQVTVQVSDRSHTLHVQNDAFSVLADNVGHPLDVLSNDRILPGGGEPLTIRDHSKALHGQVSLNERRTGLVYTPASDFVGTDTLSYTATDNLGGSGTAEVLVFVGDLTVNPDVFVVPENTVTKLDVLANDRILNTSSGAVTIVNVSPSDTPIGEIQPSTDGLHLDFTSTAQHREQTFTYTIEGQHATNGAAPRQARGQVHVIVHNDIVVANPDVFSVASDSTANQLPVLLNDAAIPARGRLSLVPVGTGRNGNHGGTVTLNDSSDGLLYAPAPGFSGEETFTYTMTDSRRTDSARVVVKVDTGSLKANNDAFTVFFEKSSPEPAPRAFTLPVLNNDRVLPDRGQLLTITGVGIDDTNASNAPNRAGRVEISADGTSLFYTPRDEDGPFPYEERFTYEISNGTTRRAEATVRVTVQQRAGARNMTTNDDAFTLARDSQNNALPVLVNDHIKPASASSWVIASVTRPSHNGIATFVGPTIFYSPRPGFIGVETFDYVVSDGFGGTGTATVHATVGNLPVSPDLFVALSDSQANAFDVLANDHIRPNTAESFNLVDAIDIDRGGTLSVQPRQTDTPVVVYTPDSNVAHTYPYTESFSYRLQDDAGGHVNGKAAVRVFEVGSDRNTSTLTVTVNGVNDPPVISGTSGSPGTVGTVPDHPVFISIIEKVKPFPDVQITEVDDQGNERLDITVTLEPENRGRLTHLGEFTDAGNGEYRLTEVTATAATEALRALVFDPVEDRIIAPTSEVTTLTIAVDDRHVAAPVIDDSTQIVVTGWVAYWPLNETSGTLVTDSAGTPQDGTIFGAPRLGEQGPPSPSAETAVRFRGRTRDYIAMAHHEVFELSEGTVMLWFRTTEQRGRQTLLAKDHHSEGTNNSGHLNLGLNERVIEVRLQEQPPQGREENHQIITKRGDRIVQGDWYHLAFSFGPGGMKLYLNGELAGEDDFHGGLAANHEALVIGATNFRNKNDSGDLSQLQLEEPFQGDIDEVAIFYRALTQAQIQSLLTEGIRLQ